VKRYSTPDIYLASQSPRRRKLLEQICICHRLVPAPVDEMPYPGEAPAEYVIRLALAKADAGWKAVIPALWACPCWKPESSWQRPELSPYLQESPERSKS